MADITIPAALLPADGRFGCGPSKVRTEQIEFLASLQPGVLGTKFNESAKVYNPGNLSVNYRQCA